MNKKNSDSKIGKIFSTLTSTMMILSIVSALFVGFVPTTKADVTSAVVTVTPAIVGTENATYKIKFNVTTGLTKNTDWVGITFPGDTIVNSTYLEGTVSNGTATASIGANFTVINLFLKIIVPVNITELIWINLTKGITNPT
ncbi:MAG: hypothetical protein QXS02_05685, partial [Candidatus Thermoplasmatota archaeon]